MRNKVVVAGHALHPALVVLPLGLLGTSPLWDILRLATGDALWGAIAFWTIAAGVVAALAAAIPGFIDYLGIPPQSRARSVATWHMILNLALIGLFLLSLAGRAAFPRGYAHAGVVAMLPAWLGVLVATVSGWLGGELVLRLGIGVDDDANPNAPSSLARRHRPPRGRPVAVATRTPGGSPSKA
jgi:uncharacterized membrane protein